MRRIRGTIFWVIVLIAGTGLMVLSNGCKKSSNTDVPASGVMVTVEGCKQSAAVPASGTVNAVAPGAEDCIQYEYDGQGGLKLTHINAGFNCCPGQISADIQIAGNVITIRESESEAGCHCLCLYDVFYDFINLQSGTYVFKLIEPYKEEGDQTFEFSLNLSAASQDVICIQRNYYPWSQ